MAAAGWGAGEAWAREAAAGPAAACWLQAGEEGLQLVSQPRDGWAPMPS